MARKNDSILLDLIELPWWASVIVAAIVYAGLTFVLPAVLSKAPLLKGVPDLPPRFVWMVAAVFLFPAPFAAIRAARKRRLLERQDGIESIRLLSWKEFEDLLGEAYRRQGYKVHENAAKGPDGGVDLRIERNGNAYLVQCKQWRSSKVGVNFAAHQN